MQFGREVSALMLGMPERADWKLCAMDRAGEEKVTLKFRQRFQPFDFTLAGGEG